MGTVYAFFADGFEEIEAFTAVDTLRRAGLNVQIVSVTPDEIVMGAHDVSLLCDINFENCDFFDADLLLLPGGMPGAATLDKHEGLRKLLLDFAAKGKPIAAICAAPMVLGKLGLLKGRKATCYPSFEQYLEGAECVSEPCSSGRKYHHRYGTGRCYGVCSDHRRSVGRQRKSRRTGRSDVCKTLSCL